MYANFQNDRMKFSKSVSDGRRDGGKLILSIFRHISKIDAINQKMLLNKKFLEFDFVYVCQFSERSDKILVTEGQMDKVSYKGASLLKMYSYYSSPCFITPQIRIHIPAF